MEGCGEGDCKDVAVLEQVLTPVDGLLGMGNAVPGRVLCMWP